jgi:hypothetical protein
MDMFISFLHDMGIHLFILEEWDAFFSYGSYEKNLSAFAAWYASAKWIAKKIIRLVYLWVWVYIML